jgi:hypothetical protein
MKHIKINKQFLLSNWKEYEYLTKYMGKSSGSFSYPGWNSDYPLYAYLSTFFNNDIILEIGTCFGGSAVMMSHNSSNKIITYDITNIREKITRENIEFRVGNFMDDNIDYDNINFITIDVDPHDGVQETEMIKFLEKNWKGGLLLLDDIRLNTEMNNFWNSIDENNHEKFDISDIGHVSGTGLINFNKAFKVTIE